MALTRSGHATGLVPGIPTSLTRSAWSGGSFDVVDHVFVLYADFTLQLDSVVSTRSCLPDDEEGRSLRIRSPVFS